METVLEILFVVGAFLIVLSVHEAAHAFVANLLGDPTAKIRGRVTLNPLAHLDPMGTLVLFVTQMVGWGKPVPIDPRNFRHPVRDSALTALAGPLSNFVLSFFLAIPLVYLGDVMPGLLAGFLSLVFNLSIYLGVFNFLPLPPLDGSKIIGLLVPRRFYPHYERFLNGGIKYFVAFLLFDWMVLSDLFGFSFLGYLVSNGANIVKFLIVFGF